MSRIDELIAEYCPSGVEFNALGDIAVTVPGLTGKTKADFSNGNARYVSYKNAFANLAVDQSAGDFVSVGENERQNRLRLGDVVITGSSESLDEVGLSSVVVTEPNEPLYLNSFCFALRFTDPSLLSPDFSKYLLRADSVRAQIRRCASGVTRINISKPRFMKVRIPVPPLEVQREIVRVLDTFTALEAELEAELEARRRQYEHHEHTAFAALSAAGARLVALRDIGKWYGGGTPSKAKPEYWSLGTIPWISPKDMGVATLLDTEDHITEAAVAGSATRLVPGNAVALVARSSILDHTLPIAFVPGPASLNQDMKAVIAAEGILPKYVFHALHAARPTLLRQVRRAGGSVASLDSKKLWEFMIPVPDLDQQFEIVEKLSNFDSLVNDLSIGLPAELAARRKQYDYYRDKLLTFEEASA